MKAVLMSIQPKWCEKIANGAKTIEVRKSRPKLETPFKVYIYCTNGKDLLREVPCYYRHKLKETNYKIINEDYNKNPIANGKVIGEFVCDRIDEYECSSDGFGELSATCGTCLTYDEILNYCNGNDLYGWHITDLKIYDKPKELSEFLIDCKNCGKKFVGDPNCWQECVYGYRRLTRPPQSWCYVEELQNG